MAETVQSYSDKDISAVHQNIQFFIHRADSNMKKASSVKDPGRYVLEQVRDPLILHSAKKFEELGVMMGLPDFERGFMGLYAGKRLYTDFIIGKLQRKSEDFRLEADRREAWQMIQDQKDEEAEHCQNVETHFKSEYEGIFTETELERYVRAIKDTGFS
jgi:hypothetical protein